MFNDRSYKDIFNKAEILVQSVNEITILGGDKKIGRFLGIYGDKDRNFKYDPYFKYYNSYSYKKSKYIARISIMKPEYVIHKNYDGKINWFLSSKEIRKLNYILFDLGYYNIMIDKLIQEKWIDKSIENEIIQLKNNPPDYSQLRRD